ncbi:hypothetical protein NZD89_24665 [Alicyclobacillus fastidiosus]|uniref:Uncharacterized protein n=1 Tax=Alicyclobacillus fastidiosus TaxID=392011 RepID=A0ABY6ZEX9_9BACL|nr:CBO0543 family protein [Alicyclobacillus fastidiosus]WAH41401.1 hypothetical protein NZD89_24665 [Alicyclobacillus fastidiosus]GMA63020.1 hypothetical protein GCM10025859_34600 [Alicyclobacillus fastidiosus]
MKNVPTWDDVVKARTVLAKTNYEYWVHHNLFSFGWWILVVACIITAGIWWKLVDKKRIFEVMGFGLIIAAIASLLDELGAQNMLWGYPNMILPLVPPLVSVNYFAFPTIYSLIYQYCPRWKTFVCAMVIMSAVFSFLTEPLLIWLRLYELNNWKSIYSFPIYILIGICVKAIVDQLIQIRGAKTT